MIKGMKIDVPSEDMKKIIEARIEYHTNKAKWYDDQVANLKAGGVDASKGYSNDPTASLAGSARNHRNKVKHFEILLKYLIPNEVYRLREVDLQLLEVTRNPFE